MGVAFSRTTRALNADRGIGSRLMIVTGLMLLAAWTGWFLFGRITLYQASRAAHIEVATSSRDIATLHGGKLVASGLFIGRRVHAGEVLAELDSEQEKLRLADAEHRLSGFPARLAALQQELSSTQTARIGALREKSAQLAAALARARAAQASADFNQSLSQKQQQDSEAGASAPIDAERAVSEARRAAAMRDASQHDAVAIAGSASTSGAERTADAARISATVFTAKSDQAAAEAAVVQLRYELETRKIRAPSDGIIGDVASLKLGEILDAGRKLATLVPDGDLHVVAAFDPATGLGRLNAGQSARLRLDGFSWVQYGDFPARVERVAAESSGNILRVELRMPRRRNEDMPLRHGMTGQVDVAIEQISPALLLMRTIGQVIA